MPLLQGITDSGLLPKPVHSIHCESDEHLHSREQVPVHVRLQSQERLSFRTQSKEHGQLAGTGAALFMSLMMIALELLSALQLGLLVGNSWPEGWSSCMRRH